MTNPFVSMGVLRLLSEASKKQFARVREAGYWDAEGVRVMMSRAKDLTKKGLLDVPFHFQVPPTDEWTIQSSVSFTDYEILGGDTLSRAGARALDTVSFSTLWLDYESTSIAVHHRGSLAEPAEPHTPLEARAMLLGVMDARTPFRLQIGNPDLWDGRWDVNMLATLRSVDFTERAGEPDARYVNVSFARYTKEDLDTRYDPKLPTTVTINRDGTATDKAGHKIGSPVDEVTLHTLARIYYGAPSKWRHITNANPAWSKWNASRPMSEAPKGRQMKLKLPKVKHAAARAR